MSNVDEYHKGAGYYEFPDGTKVRGKDAAEEYAADLADFDSVADEVEEVEETEDTPVEETVEEEVVEEETVEEETVEESEPKQVLVEMTRPNRLFEIAGETRSYTFRSDAKIMVVNAEDVDRILAQGGFRVVEPSKAKEYYS